MSQPHTFTRDEMSRGGQRGGAVLRQRAEQRALIASRVAPLVAAIETGDIGQRLLEITLRAAARLDEGIETFPLVESIDHYRLSQVVETMHKVYRLETGQSTSNSAHATVDVDELSARLTALRNTEVVEQPTDTA